MNRSGNCQDLAGAWHREDVSAAGPGSDCTNCFYYTTLFEVSNQCSCHFQFASWQKSAKKTQFILGAFIILGSGRKRRVWHIYNEREDTLRLSRVPCDTLYRLGMRLLQLVWARRLRDLPGQFPYVITLTLLSKVAWLEPRIRQPLAFLWIEVYSMVQSKHCHQFDLWLFLPQMYCNFLQGD